MVAMGAATPDDPLLSAREALAAGDWASARSYFEQARELGETAEILDGLSVAAHFRASTSRRLS